MLPQTAVFAVTNYRPLPYTHVLWAGERFRTILMGIASKQYGFNDIPSLISGRNPDGSVRTDSHAHISYLSIPDTEKQTLSHTVLYSSVGFNSEMQIIIMMFRKFWFSSEHDYSVKLLGFFDLDFTSELLLDRYKIFSIAHKWESLTPFVLNRHLHLKKSRMRNPELRNAEIENALEKEVRKELELRSLPDPIIVSFIRERGIKMGGKFLAWRDFKRNRLKREANQANNDGYGFRIVFPEPVQGPISLGYGCHFGLGLFRAIPDK